MKKLIYIFLLIIAVACSNQEVDFPDYDYTAVYFPLQYPLRTLNLGEDRIDNSLDKELKFHIGCVIGGMYENNKTWTVDYMVDNSLADNLVNAQGEEVYALPSAYYTLTPQNTMTIYPGDFSGLVEVQLNDAFLDDTLAVTGRYVIPLRMTGSNADSILNGLPVVSNPDKRVPTDWDASVQPKDFVLFGIKFINPYHGFYLHRGKDVSKGPGGEVLKEIVYSEEFVERDQVWELVTSGRDEVIAKGIGVNSGSEYAMKLKFTDNGTIVIDSVTTSPFKAYGTGKYVVDGGEWGGEKHNAMFLDYQYKEVAGPGPLDTLGKINLTIAGSNDALYLPSGWINITSDDNYPWPAALKGGILFDKNDVPLVPGTSGEKITIFPEGVSASYNYIHPDVKDPVIFTVTGLDPAKKYNFDFFGSRASGASGTRKLFVTINGVTKDVIAVGNTSTLISFTEIQPDGSGQIIILATQESGQYGYINAIIVTTKKSNIVPVHHVTDTLVFRNNGIIFQENSLTVVN